MIRFPNNNDVIIEFNNLVKAGSFMPGGTLDIVESFGKKPLKYGTQDSSGSDDFGLKWIIEDIKGYCSSYEIEVSSLK